MLIRVLEDGLIWLVVALVAICVIGGIGPAMMHREPTVKRGGDESNDPPR
jgi:hypothetical protein